MNIIPIHNIWDNLRIERNFITCRFSSYLGDKSYYTSNKKESQLLLQNLLDSSKDNICNYITKYDAKDIIWSLTLIYNLVVEYYFQLKQVREELENLSINNVNIIDKVNSNNILAILIMDSINIWIENTLLFDNQIIKEFDAPEIEQHEFLIDIFVYYLCSYSLTLIALSNEKIGYKTLRIDANDNIPILPNRIHDADFYTNQIIFGNCGILNDTKIEDLENSNIDKAFNKSFRLSLLDFLSTLTQLNELRFNTIFPSNVIKLKEFHSILAQILNDKIEVAAFIENFLINKDKLITQVDINDNIVWKKGVNRYRLELCPIIELNNEVFISRAHIIKSLDNWYSYVCNGGCIYTNFDNAFSKGLEIINNDLSNRLVDRIIRILEQQYPDLKVQKNISYSKIFGNQNIDFGDYDIIAYSDKCKAVFIVESKYISDSFNASSVVRDLNEFYKKDGHYFKFKRRCKLILNQKGNFKRYFDLAVPYNAHFLFISSKTLNLPAQIDDLIFALNLKSLPPYLKRQINYYSNIII